MVDVRIVAVSVIAVLSVFLQLGIRAQPTISSSFEDDSCSQLEEERDFQVEENMRMRSLLENNQQKIETLGNVSNSQAEDNHRLNKELENKQRLIASLRNVSSAQTKENLRLNMELEDKQQLIETLENVSYSPSVENQRLKLENERHRLTTQPVTVTYIGRLYHGRSIHGITKVEDKIYVLFRHPHEFEVYGDQNNFHFIRQIGLDTIDFPTDVVYSNKSKRVYISDINKYCIWVMATTGEHRLTKLLTSVFNIYTLSLSNEGHLLVLRHPTTHLEIYSLNATLIRRLQLPQDAKESFQVVQTSTGNFIILHRLNETWSGPWVISQLTNDGQLIHRFIPMNQSEKLSDPKHLSLDSDNNRLFVADYNNHQVIVFNSSDLTWIQVLIFAQINEIWAPVKLFYHASKKHFFIAQDYGNVNVYKIN